jgi:F0F1-type ATP synthase assembly protein I
MDESGSKTPRHDSGGTWIREFGPYLTIGMQLAIAVVGFFFVGRWLDDIFGTSPWLMIVGLTLGTVGGFISFFRSAISMVKKEDEQEQESRESARREDR